MIVIDIIVWFFAAIGLLTVLGFAAFGAIAFFAYLDYKLELRPIKMPTPEAFKDRNKKRESRG